MRSSPSPTTGTNTGLTKSLQKKVFGPAATLAFTGAPESFRKLQFRCVWIRVQHIGERPVVERNRGNARGLELDVSRRG
jgi:hypothetical protein